MTSELVTAEPGQLSGNQILSGLHTVRTVLAPDLSDDELKLFAMVAARSGLDPFAHQIYAVKRKGRVTFQTGIDGYRSIAARTGLYDGQDEPEYGPVCGCDDKRPAGHPEYATVRVYRKGVGRPIAATAYWHEYKPEAGQSGQGDVMWTRMPRVMIAKVAEALALRKAFPYDPDQKAGIGADVYTADEMAQADRPVEPRPDLRQRLAERVESTRSLGVVLAARDAEGTEGPSTLEAEAEAASMLTEDYARQQASKAEVTAETEERGTQQAAGEEAAVDGAAPVTPPAGAASAMVQCESRSAFDPEVQCRREQGHSGVHRTDNESWGDPK